jgi:ribosome recycling factor
MQLDRKKLDRLLGMNDEQLSALVQSIAKESGIDPSALGLNPNNIQSIRQALGSATDEDLKELDKICNSYRQQKKNR